MRICTVGRRISSFKLLCKYYYYYYYYYYYVGANSFTLVALRH